MRFGSNFIKNGIIERQKSQILVLSSFRSKPKYKDLQSSVY